MLVTLNTKDIIMFEGRAYILEGYRNQRGCLGGSLEVTLSLSPVNATDKPEKRTGIGNIPIGCKMVQESLVEKICTKCKGTGTKDMIFSCARCNGTGVEP